MNLHVQLGLAKIEAGSMANINFSQYYCIGEISRSLYSIYSVYPPLECYHWIHSTMQAPLIHRYVPYVWPSYTIIYHIPSYIIYHIPLLPIQYIPHPLPYTSFANVVLKFCLLTLSWLTLHQKINKYWGSNAVLPSRTYTYWKSLNAPSGIIHRECNFYISYWYRVIQSNCNE